MRAEIDLKALRKLANGGALLLGGRKYMRRTCVLEEIQASRLSIELDHATDARLHKKPSVIDSLAGQGVTP